jgi:serine/threonine protein kinase
VTIHLINEDERYKIDSKVGTGAMATVFKAYDNRLHRTVALKILHEHLSSNSELILRFEQEAKLAARIDHPNIVRTYDFGLNKNDQYFIVSEFVDGRSLTVAMRQYKNESQQALHPILAALVALEVSKGVEAAHQHSVIHRDLKPDNVLVSNHGEIKLTDFGVARPFDSSMTQVGQFLGSLTYASPEQIKSEPLDARSDIFSLGVMLFEILTGRLPFRSSNPTDLALKISRAEVEPLSQLRPAIPKELDQMVRQCLRANPNERHQNASSIVSQLESYLKNEAVSPSSNAISDGFLNPELFTSTIRRGPVLQVERPISQEPKTETKTETSSPVDDKAHEYAPKKQALNNSSKYRSHDPKVGSRGKPVLVTTTTQRRYVSFILTTASITLIMVTLIVQERSKIIRLLRGGSEQSAQEQPSPENTTASPSQLESAVEKDLPVGAPQVHQSPSTSAAQPSVSTTRPTKVESKTTEYVRPRTDKAQRSPSKRKSSTARTIPKNNSESRQQQKTILNKPFDRVPKPRLAKVTPSPQTNAEKKVTTGQIVIKTQPGEMTVYINGVFEGLSSKQDSVRTFTIPAGNVTLKIPSQENNGRLYREYVGRFRIESGKSVAIPTIVLSPADDSSKGEP